MTQFENDLLEKLLYMKQKELNELAESSELKLKKEEIEKTAKMCSDLANRMFFIETHKYTGLK